MRKIFRLITYYVKNIRGDIFKRETIHQKNVEVKNAESKKTSADKTSK
jgi:hypothetical protein